MAAARIFAIRRTKSWCDSSTPAFPIQVALGNHTALHGHNLDAGSCQQPINVPVQFLFLAEMPGDPGVDVSRGTAGVDIAANRKQELT